MLLAGAAACGGDDDESESETPRSAESGNGATTIDDGEALGTREPTSEAASAEANGTVTIELDGKRIEGDASECIVSESAINVRATGTLEDEPVVITVERIAIGDDWILTSRITGTDGSRRYESSNADETEMSGSTLRTTAEWVWDPTGRGDQSSGDGTLEATCSSVTP
jgi:hypothetical protein